jgi:two-component system NarL family sensor kinase
MLAGAELRMHTPRNSIPASRQAGPPVRPRHLVGWLVAFMFATSAAFVALRMVTPSDGTQLPPRPEAWTGDGVIVHANPGQPLHDRDLVTAIDGVPLGSAGRSWRVRAYQPGDRLTYQVVRGGHSQEVTVTLRRADAGRLWQGRGTILVVVAFLGVAVYLYTRRAGPATAALLVLGSGLLSSTVAVELGVSAVDTRGGPFLWLYLLSTYAVYVTSFGGLAAFVLVFPRPWPPLTRHRWLLPVAYATPPALWAAAWALAALDAGLSTRWIGRVVAAELTIVMAVLGLAVVLAVARSLTETDPVARQQLKWVVGGGGLSATLALAVWYLPVLVAGEGLLPLESIGFAGLPLLAGLTVAVLRHRLFDLDRVVSRTVAYALLTVLLGGGYAGVVLGLGQLLGRDRPGLAVAVATLAVAAAFQPARRRIQDVVDRRFNRRRHDAARTIQAFTSRLGQQIDLGTLTSELLTVADQTMQPTRVSLWLRPTPSPESLQRGGGTSPHRT